jgi:hypothetical protein
MDPAGQQVTDTGTPGVIARPPPPLSRRSSARLRLGSPAALAVPGCEDRPGPLDQRHHRRLTDPPRYCVFAAGIRNFSRAATPVPTNEPTRALVTTGIHGWSRNPIYLGMFLVYGGIGIVVRSPWILILALPLAILIRYGVVAREEAYLERRFGDAYLDYKRRVRRWL